MTLKKLLENYGLKCEWEIGEKVEQQIMKEYGTGVGKSKKEYEIHKKRRVEWILELRGCVTIENLEKVLQWANLSEKDAFVLDIYKKEVSLVTGRKDGGEGFVFQLNYGRVGISKLIKNIEEKREGYEKLNKKFAMQIMFDSKKDTMKMFNETHIEIDEIIRKINQNETTKKLSMELNDLFDDILLARVEQCSG